MVRLPPHQGLGREAALRGLVVAQGRVLRAPVQDQGLVRSQDLPNKVQGRGGLVLVLRSGLNVLHLLSQISTQLPSLINEHDIVREMGCRHLFPHGYAKDRNE